MSNECVKPEIPQFPELTFEEERHLYYLNGLEVPSVTTLMKPLSSDFYSTVDPEVLNKAAKRGTAIHNAVENYAKFGIEDIPPVYAGYFSGFREWWDILTTSWVRWNIVLFALRTNCWTSRTSKETQRSIIPTAKHRGPALLSISGLSLAKMKMGTICQKRLLAASILLNGSPVTSPTIQ